MTGKDVAMPAADFLAWLKAMNLNDSKAAQALGLGSRNTLVKYKIEGAPLYIALACAALARGVAPWSPRNPLSGPFAVERQSPEDGWQPPVGDKATGQ